MTAPRFEHRPQDFIGVPNPEMVIVGIADRAAFDRIAAPVLDAGENDLGHVLVKSVGGNVMVIFQHWIKSRTVEALLADMDAERDAKASGATP